MLARGPGPPLPYREGVEMNNEIPKAHGDRSDWGQLQNILSRINCAASVSNPNTAIGPVMLAAAKYILEQAEKLQAEVARIEAEAFDSSAEA
jgi:hypothetical protein